MNTWFLLAGLSSVFTAMVHTFVGQKEIVRPLLDTPKFHHISRFTNYYCWHIVTIVLFSMGAMFFVAASQTQSIELAWVATLYATAFVIWNVLMIGMHKLKLKHFPQWVLILPTALLGWCGLLV